MSRIELGKDTAFQDALKVCQAVHDDRQKFTIKWILRGPDGRTVLKVASTWGTITDQQQHFAESEADGWEAFMLIGMTDDDGLSSARVVGTWAVAVDLDYAVDMSRWNNAPYRPSIAINTSGGRQHLIWILKARIVDSDMFRKMVVALAHRFEGDACFANLTQAIRLPGFKNQKHGNEVALSLYEPDRWYDYDELAAAFDVDLIAASLQARIPVTRSLGVSVKTDEDKRHRLADLRDALHHIDPDPYDTWIKVIGAAAALGEDGFKLVDEWSRRSNKYDEHRMQIAWKSFAAGASASPSSIFYMAQLKGWTNPGRRKVAAAREVLNERSLGRMLADIMYPDIAVARNGHGEKQWLQALRWNENRYARLDQFAFRTVVESYGHRLIQKASGTDSNLAVVAAVAKHSGSGQALDSLGRTALEFMLDASDSLQATKYPYFPVANGVLNLLSGELVPGRIRPISYHNSAVTFDPQASAPRFEAFLAEIFEGDDELVRFFLRLCGQMLLGKPKEHLFVFFLGPTGRNGKSVAVEVLNAIFGGLACTLGVSALMAKGTMTDGPTPSIAKLEGKRFVSVNEPTKKHTLDGGLVKQLTGGDRVAARALYGADVEFLPEFTPVMIANEMPVISADDNAIWRRIIVIPFMHTFSDEEIDRDLKSKLLLQLPGILNLLLQGLRDYLENGLQPPERVRRAGNEQRKRADGFEAWREERTMSFQGKTQYKSLHEDYLAWTAANRSYEKLNSRDFGAKLAATYVRLEQRHYIFYEGVRLKDLSGAS
ncbi:phage/plasmid primase, P4 family [Burkholderia cepacia]|uniref:Primase n=1 Tax=Burkholderia cepacia GG4 TaxID=1009846 RepID=A0A9W3K284_BURCE|nr:phage/plasmid primase, P4 family [Burkholderia cepacia]AFQ49449.1 primase [Burkholderia cepacia GG4]